MFNIVDKRRWFFLASGALIVFSLAALTVSTIGLGLPLQLSADPTDAGANRAGGLAILVAVIVAPVLILRAFRRTPKAFRYSLCATATMLHNLLITCGFYALMGIVADWAVDPLFLTAVLAAIGFSIQDLTAVFDRIRENTAKRRVEFYESVANRSIIEAINPTLATRLCATLVLVALIVIAGGTAIMPFIATLLVGMVSETYSALLVAVPLLVAWEKAAARRAAARASV